MYIRSNIGIRIVKRSFSGLSLGGGNNLLALEHTNELLMQQQPADDDPAGGTLDYSEVMSSILMEVLTLMSGGKFPPGVKKKEHVRVLFNYSLGRQEASKQGELTENMLQNLFLNLPPQTVQLRSRPSIYFSHGYKTRFWLSPSKPGHNPLVRLAHLYTQSFETN